MMAVIMAAVTNTQTRTTHQELTDFITEARTETTMIRFMETDGVVMAVTVTAVYTLHIIQVSDLV